MVRRASSVQAPLPAATGTAGVRVAAAVAFTEGPAVDTDGTVYFTDIENDRILRLLHDGSHAVFRTPAGRANGQAFGPDGCLYHCEGAEFGPGGGRRITRTDLRRGTYDVVTDRYRGARYNAPNDLCFDGRGRLYFTDPRYGSRNDLEMDVEGVYRLDPAGSVTRILEQPAIQRPNGIAVTQDGRLLYIVDSNLSPGGHRRVWGFRLSSDGRPRDQRLVFDFSPGRGGDGMELDLDGNLYVAAGINVPRGAFETADYPAGVYVISPQGELMARIPVAEDPVTNVAFGGPDGRGLFITAGKSLFETRVDVPGQVAHRWW
jgi:gluconolactonase